jgi:hypothetical protein
MNLVIEKRYLAAIPARYRQRKACVGELPKDKEAVKNTQEITAQFHL